MYPQEYGHASLSRLAIVVAIAWLINSMSTKNCKSSTSNRVVLVVAMIKVTYGCPVRCVIATRVTKLMAVIR
jgi:hypothetical protein